MRSHARVFGHPIHQMLVPIPLGLFVVGSALDLVQRFTAVEWIPTVSFWNLLIGVVAALVAVIFGAIDLVAIPEGTRAKTIGGMHAVGNIVVVACFSVALFMRQENRFDPPSTLALGLELAALILLGLTGWLGGELVDRLGVGVDDGANVDAPSSLTHDVGDTPRVPS